MSTPANDEHTDVSKDVPKDVPQNVAKEVAQNVPQEAPQEAAQEVTQEVSQDVPQGDVPVAPEAVGDADSALGDEEDLLSTSSLASSIFNYRQENGRTYNSYGEAYILPNDETELDRLDLQHHLLKLTWADQLATIDVAKSDGVHRVLDVGTGTGIWAIEWGDQHPESMVLGVDVSPVQPAFVPPNVSFEISDLTQTWTFTHKFDFIFSRMMTGAFGDWPSIIQQYYDNLEPGGSVEIQDIFFDVRSDDGTLAADSPLRQWSQYMLEASINLGAPLDSILSVKGLLEETGFVDVKQKIACWPMTVWAKDPRYKKIGLWTFHNMSGSLSGISVALFTRGLGWTVEELEVFLVGVRKDMRNTKIHAYWPIYSVTAKKPKM